MVRSVLAADGMIISDDTERSGTSSDKDPMGAAAAVSAVASTVAAGKPNNRIPSLLKPVNPDISSDSSSDNAAVAEKKASTQLQEDAAVLTRVAVAGAGTSIGKVVMSGPLNEGMKISALKKLANVLTKDDRGLMADWLALAKEKISRQHRKKTRKLRKKREAQINQFIAEVGSSEES